MQRSIFSAFTRFVALSLLCVLTLALVMGFALSSLLTRSISDWEWQNTAAFVRREVAGLEALFTAPQNVETQERWATELSRRVTGLPEVMRVKVWDRSATVLWSDDSRLIGQRFPNNDELQESLAGEVAVEIKAAHKAEQAYERDEFPVLAEIYVPIFSREKKGEVIGVLEVYKKPVQLLAAIRRGRIIIWGISLAGGLALYGVLLPLVRHVYRREIEEAALRKYARQLEESARALQEKNAELDTFVYSVSHDLKAPLVTIQGMAGVLLEDHGGTLGHEGRRYLDRIQANILQMERLIQDLLALARIGREARAPEAINLSELADECLIELAEPIRRGGVKVIRGDLATVRAVRTQMEQVLRNLLGNAIKYLGSTPTPTVEIGSVDRGGVVECYVRDNGIGIDPAYHENIFAIFHRLKDVEAEGTGVGLAIVKKVVEAAGGRVWVESAKGEGATFRFTWPKTVREPGA